MSIYIFGQPEVCINVYFPFSILITTINENMGFILKTYIWQGFTEKLYNLSEILEVRNSKDLKISIHL